MNFLPSDKVTQIRERIGHPIIDSDGHLIEYLPLVRDFIVEEAGEDVANGYDRSVKSALMRTANPSPERRRQLGIHAVGVWGIPARNSLDRATVIALSWACTKARKTSMRSACDRAFSAWCSAISICSGRSGAAQVYPRVGAPAPSSA